MQEQPQHRHQHNVQRGDEAGLAGGGFRHARLLQVGGNAQRRAAAQASQQQVPAGMGQRLYRLRSFCLQEPPVNGKSPTQHHRRHQTAQQVKGKGRDIIAADALRHKGGAPDKGRQHREQVLSDLRVHEISSFFHLLRPLPLK